MGYPKEQISDCAIPDDLDNNIELDVEKSWLSILR
jgi:hypothetical protein